MLKTFINKLTGKNKIYKLEKELEAKKAYINKLISYQIHCQEDYPEIYPCALSPDEIQTLKKYLRESKNYLEFGAGGSTFIALSMPEPKIYSVESDLNWINYLKSWKIIKQAGDNNRLKFIHADIGPTVEWGYPANGNMKDEFYKYSSSVFEKVHPDFDTIFVDGRFRVACVLKAITECKNDFRLLIHDYPPRDFYHIIEKYLDIIHQTDSLYIFKKKSNIDIKEVKQLYEKYKNDYR